MFIQLTKGYQTIVDSDKFEELNQFSWYASGREPNVRPARRLKQIEGKKLIYIYHQILGIYPWELNNKVVDHKDRNPLNNQKDNLRIVSQQENMLNSITSVNKRGISFDTTHGKWKCYLDIPCIKRVNVGTFKTEQEALNALIVAKKVYGCE